MLSDTDKPYEYVWFLFFVEPFRQALSALGQCFGKAEESLQFHCVQHCFYEYESGFESNPFAGLLICNEGFLVFACCVEHSALQRHLCISAYILRCCIIAWVCINQAMFLFVVVIAKGMAYVVEDVLVESGGFHCSSPESFLWFSFSMLRLVISNHEGFEKT